MTITTIGIDLAKNAHLRIDCKRKGSPIGDPFAATDCLIRWPR